LRPIAADFAPRRTVPRWLWASACLVLLLVAAPQAWYGFRLAEQARAVQAQVQQAEAARQLALRRRAADARSHESIAAYAQDAAAIARVASFDAAGVLAAVESARVAGIRVTSLEINAVDATARLELEVRDASDLLKYLDDINAAMDAPQRWRLVRSQSATPTNVGSATLVRQDVAARGR